MERTPCFWFKWFLWNSSLPRYSVNKGFYIKHVRKCCVPYFILGESQAINIWTLPRWCIEKKAIWKLCILLNYLTPKEFRRKCNNANEAIEMFYGICFICDLCTACFPQCLWNILFLQVFGIYFKKLNSHLSVYFPVLCLRC